MQSDITFKIQHLYVSFAVTKTVTLEWTTDVSPRFSCFHVNLQTVAIAPQIVLLLSPNLIVAHTRGNHF